MTTAEPTDAGTGEGRLSETIETVDTQRVALYVVLAGLIGFYLSPLWAGLTTAFKTQTGFVETTPVTPPTPAWFTLEPWNSRSPRCRVG